jgi:hypothetical protein
MMIRQMLRMNRNMGGSNIDDDDKADLEDE